MRANFSTLSQYRRTLWLRTILTGAALTATCWSASVPAANIIVNSLLDDVLPDAAGNITPALAAPECTLRMAIASANMDLPVGGATLGCAASTTPATTHVAGGADIIGFKPSLANGAIMLDATQAMNTASATNILYITGPTTIDGGAATAITLDGGSLTATPNKCILGIAEFPAAGASLAGSSIWVNLLSLNFQNARVESAGACVLSFENLRIFNANFSNCVATNTPTVAPAAGGALFMRASDNAASTVRPDARLTRVIFKGDKALDGGSASNPGGGAFFLVPVQAAWATWR